MESRLVKEKGKRKRRKKNLFGNGGRRKTKEKREPDGLFWNIMDLCLHLLTNPYLVMSISITKGNQ